MPTGYTADIKDGISFKTFALNCARAFGACVTLRDEPGGGENIPDQFEPSDHYIKAVQQTRDELATLLAMSPEQHEVTAIAEWHAAEARRQTRLEEKRKLRDAYEAMLVQVCGWMPPTPEHQGLRRFMEEQITQSIEFDCGNTYDAEPAPKLSGEQWAANNVAELNCRIAYYEKAHAEEVARAAGRTAWVRALRESLS